VPESVPAEALIAGEAKPATMAGFLFAEAGPRFAATLAYSLAVGRFASN
jgi:hypothetical protein